MTPLLRTFLLVALIATSLVTAGCAGSNRIEVRTVGETEGLYIDIGELKYQVQISRELNPGDREDSAYLVGLPAGEKLKNNESWFGVFVRAQNTTEEKTLPMAEDFEIVDSEGHHYEPVDINLELNPWAYQPGDLAPGEVFPPPNSVQAQGPIKGGLLLFKIPVEAYQNRPFEFELHGPGEAKDTGMISLDV